MPSLVGTTWRTHALTIHILEVDEIRQGAELSIITEPPSGNRASVELFWQWVHRSHAECDNGVLQYNEEPCLIG